MINAMSKCLQISIFALSIFFLFIFFCHSVLVIIGSCITVAAVLIYIAKMSLTCLACRTIGSPSPSFRSYSVSSSSSEDDGQCAALIACLARRVTVAATGTGNAISTSKVAPLPMVVSGQGLAGAPRLQRSRAMSRDRVRNWNF